MQIVSLSHANSLLMRQFAWSVRSYFLANIKKYITSLSSAEFANSTVSVKCYLDNDNTESSFSWYFAHSCKPQSMLPFMSIIIIIFWNCFFCNFLTSSYCQLRRRKTYIRYQMTVCGIQQTPTFLFFMCWIYWIFICTNHFSDSRCSYRKSYLKPIYAEWTLLLQLFLQVHFLYSGCLISFYYYHVLQGFLELMQTV